MLRYPCSYSHADLICDAFGPLPSKPQVTYEAIAKATGTTLALHEPTANKVGASTLAMR
jgi:hypothetical protein